LRLAKVLPGEAHRVEHRSTGRTRRSVDNGGRVGPVQRWPL
jgi:hypothetical protein